MEKIFVAKPFLPPLEEYQAYVAQIWESGILTNQGRLHQQFEAALSNYLDSPHIVLTTNGHLALDSALKALELEGEVITTPFTFASTPHAIVLNNLTPVFCDIKPEDYTIDETKIESLITHRTSAILPVHVYGYPCNVEAIESIAKKHGLKVIYDAAHAFGVKVGGTSIADFGDISMFSFHATKRFHSIEGGALACKDADLKTRLDLVKNFGIADEDTVLLPGQNAKMNEFQAAMGLCNLKHLDTVIARCREVSELYRERLHGLKGLSLVNLDTSIEYNYAYFPLFIDSETFGCNRDALADKLAEQNIFPRKYFYPLVTDFSCYADSYSHADLPVAKRAADSVLTLPLYYTLTDEDILRICAVIESQSN